VDSDAVDQANPAYPVKPGSMASAVPLSVLGGFLAPTTAELLVLGVLSDGLLPTPPDQEAGAHEEGGQHDDEQLHAVRR